MRCLAAAASRPRFSRQRDLTAAFFLAASSLRIAYMLLPRGNVATDRALLVLRVLLRLPQVLLVAGFCALVLVWQEVNRNLRRLQGRPPRARPWLPWAVAGAVCILLVCTSTLLVLAVQGSVAADTANNVVVVVYLAALAGAGHAFFTRLLRLWGFLSAAPSARRRSRGASATLSPASPLMPSASFPSPGSPAPPKPASPEARTPLLCQLMCWTPQGAPSDRGLSLIRRSALGLLAAVPTGYALAVTVSVMTAAQVTRQHHPWGFYASQWVVHTGEALLCIVGALVNLPRHP